MHILKYILLQSLKEKIYCENILFITRYMIKNVNACLHTQQLNGNIKSEHTQILLLLIIP